VDVLRDFASVLDEIRLSAFGFGGGLKKGTTLTNTQFVFGSAAQDSDDRIIYNSGTGALFFDQDGTGSISKIRIATLQNKPTISASDFVIF
jgi:Ca2+-binding RTX toxin-like protein